MIDRHDLDRARDALGFLDPACDRETWHRYGRAAIAAGLTVGEVDQWSSTADNYKGEKDVLAAFRTIKPDGGTGAGSLFYLARAEGWDPQANAPKYTAPTKRPTKAIEPPAKPRPGMGAAEVWERCEPATAEHGYIEAKHGTPDGLRVLPAGDLLTIAGQRMAGALVVPVRSLDGALSTLQFIPPPGAGKKLNLPNSSIAGVFVVGEQVPGGTVYLCEGIGQAWACWKATGCAAVVCFGWGRVRGVAAELRQRDASARLVVVPDVGKEKEADTIAREVGGSFVELPEGWQRNSDVNDYAQREGFEALEGLLSSASEPARPEPRFKLLRSADLHALPPLEWRIRGVLPAHGLASVYGPSASGKSFLALDMAAAVASGREWFGYRVKPAPVVYCALEGESGFRLRVAAWEQANGCTLPDGLRLVLQPFKLTEPQDVPDMAAAVLSAGAGAVTILDTLNRAAPEADENSSADMGCVLEAAKTLQRLTGGLVILVHHTGKDTTKGLRGHSSLFAALDAAVEVLRDGDRRSWRVAKAKDGADGEAHAFNLEAVELAPDDEGDAVTSCVVRRDLSPADIAHVQLPRGGNQKLLLEALRPMFKASPVFGKAGAPAPRPCLELEATVTAGAAHMTCATDRRATRAREAITGLVARGVLGCCNGWVWLT